MNSNALQRIRTSTALRPLAPEASASTNSARRAGKRAMGIGPTLQPWEGRVLPLYYARSSERDPIATRKSKVFAFRFATGSVPPLQKNSLGIFLL